MQKKDIILFNKITHEIKQVIAEIAEERTLYHNNITKLRQEQKKMRKKHDKAVKKQIKELLTVFNELLELFDDLSNDGGR